MFGSSGEITKFLLPLIVLPSTSTIVDAVDTMLFFSNVNVSVVSLNMTTSSTWISPLLIFLDWIKNLAKVSWIGIDIFPVRFASLSENSLLISSIFKTLLVLHLTKFANFVFTSWINLDFDPLLIVSISLPRSKLWIASTLCSVITSAETTVAFVMAIPTLALEDIPVSAKFFNPLVWSNLLTGSTISSKVLGLWIVYDKFWW